MNSPRGIAFTDILAFSILMAFFAGWTINIVKIVQSDLDVITGLFVARCIGVFFAPLGAILGFF